MTARVRQESRQIRRAIHEHGIALAVERSPNTARAAAARYKSADAVAYERILSAAHEAAFKRWYQDGCGYDLDSMDAVEAATRAAAKAMSTWRLTSSAGPGSSASLRMIAQIFLPAEDCARWIEEWQAELATIDKSWARRRLLLQLLFTVPRMGVTLRLEGVERESRASAASDALTSGADHANGA